MGFAVGAGKRGILADLNVVPLIDILLVLLVIFMIITPRESKGLPALIPQQGEQPRPRQPEPDPGTVVVEIRDDGSVWINQQVVPRGKLEERLPRMLAGGAARVAFVKGGSGIEFARVAEVIDLIRDAGITSVGLLTPGLERATGMV